jgi:putative FmdB family regulatory protein
MPVYIYRCDNCGVQFERQQKFTDAPLTRCPECSKKTLRKVYQPVGIVFKGSGFYSTDHHSPSGASRSSNAKSGEEETKSTANESSTSSKPKESGSSSDDKS